MLQPKKLLIKKYITFLFKLFSAVLTGIFLSIIGQSLMDYSYFSFMFIFLTVSFAFFTLVKKMGFLSVLLVDVFFILIIFLMKAYILIADSG